MRRANPVQGVKGTEPDRVREKEVCVVQDPKHRCVRETGSEDDYPTLRPLARPATSNARATRGHNLITGVHGSRHPALHPPSSTASVISHDY